MLTRSALRKDISEPLYDLVLLEIQRVEDMVHYLFGSIDIRLKERLDGR